MNSKIIPSGFFKLPRMIFACLEQAAVLCLFIALSAQATARQMLHDHLPKAVSLLTPEGPVQGTQQLQLAIGLPLRNQRQLADLIRQPELQAISDAGAIYRDVWTDRPGLPDSD